MEGIGEILQEARARRNVTLDDVEEATKIKKRYVIAMENEEWSRMPEKVYAKGFLRTYARYLGLDEHAIGDLFELSSAAKEYDKNDAVHKPSDHRRREKKQGAYQEVDLHNKPKKSMVYVLCVLSIAFLFSAIWAYKTYYLDEVEAERGAASLTVLPLPEPVPEPVEVIEEDPGPVVYTAFTIKLEAIEDCWLRLKDQETLVYEGTMRTGSVQEFTDLSAIEVRLGNAGGVELTLNGFVLPLSGTSGQIVTRHFSILDGVMIDDVSGEALS